MRFPGGPLLLGSLLLGLSAWAAVVHDLGSVFADLGQEPDGRQVLVCIAPVLALGLVLATQRGLLPSGGTRVKILTGLCLVLAGLVRGSGTGADRLLPSAGLAPAPTAIETQSVGRTLQRAGRLRDCTPDWLPRGALVRCVGRGAPLLLARSGPGPTQEPLTRLGPEHIQRVALPPPHLLDSYFDGVRSLRARLLRRMESLPSPALEALLGALVLGDRNKLEYETKDLFTRTGTRHLLALSGLHLGILFGILVLPLLRLFLRRFTHPYARVLVALGMGLVLGLFVPLAGGAPSLWRASFAAGLGFLAPLRGRPGQVLPKTDGCALLGLALAWEVLSDPWALSQPGVQLTYLATYGLLTSRGLFRGGRKPLLPPAPHDRLPLVRAWLGRVPRAFMGGVRASLVASAATLPVLWWTFGEVAPIGLIATPLVTPLVSALLLLGGLCLVSPGGFAAHLAEVLRRALVFVLEVLDGLPLTPMNLPPRPLALVICLGILCLLAIRRTPFTRRFALCLGGVLLLPWAQRKGEVHLQVLEVGHGTAAILEVPGLGMVVFDGGSRDRAGVGRALQKALNRREADRVTYLTSHSDRDHTGALPWLSHRFHAKQWWGFLPSDIDENVLHGPHRDTAGGRLLLYEGPGVRLEMVRGSALGGNEGSRSLICRAGDKTLVLWGDAEEWGAQATLNHCTEDAPVELLLLPHHGRAGSALEEVLDRLTPRLAWASSSDELLQCEPALAERQIPLEVTTSGPLYWPIPEEAALAPQGHGIQPPKSPDSSQ